VKWHQPGTQSVELAVNKISARAAVMRGVKEAEESLSV
jgi:hypothetical protein